LSGWGTLKQGEDQLSLAGGTFKQGEDQLSLAGGLQEEYKPGISLAKEIAKFECEVRSLVKFL
jgi:hypothetical protein